MINVCLMCEVANRFQIENGFVKIYYIMRLVYLNTYNIIIRVLFSAPLFENIDNIQKYTFA